MNSSGDRGAHAGQVELAHGDGRAFRVRRIIDELMARSAAGETVDMGEVARRHSDLMPELGESLGLLSGIQAAQARARAASIPGSSTSEFKAPDDTESAFLGAVLTDYELLERIHHGGQGVVYKAERRSTREVLALKVLLDGPLASARQRRRFDREIEIVTRMRHAYIVPILDSGVVHGRPYFAMEYVHGLPIDDYALLNALNVRQRVDLFLAVCDAVGHAHQKGVIHRDLKPSNILVDAEGAPHVLDFGLAKDLSPEESDRTRISITGQVLGTLPYLSPEQAACREDDVDVCTDIYALGVVLYQLLTGVFPYPVEGPAVEVRARIQSCEPVRLRRALARYEPPDGIEMGDVNADLEAVVGKALEKEPARRYRSVDALTDDLRRYLMGDAVAARGGRGFYLLGKTLRRHRMPATFAAVVLLVSGALGGYILSLTKENEAIAITRDLRTDWGFEANQGLLKRWEAAQVQGNRLTEIAELPLERVHAHIERYLRSSQGDQGLADLTRDMPKELLESVWSADPQILEPARVWLVAASPSFEALSDLLAKSSLRLALDPRTCEVGAGKEDIYWKASQACQAFVARAYHRQAQGDCPGALSDLSAANRLALDLADGVSFFQKGEALRCRALIYRFLLRSLTHALRAGTPTRVYQDWIEADPLVSPLSSAWEDVRVNAVASAQSWFVTDARGQSESLDLRLLDRLFSGSGFSIVRAMSPEDRDIVRSLRREDIAQSLDRYLEWTRDWDELIYPRLVDRTAEYERRIQGERTRDPVAYSLPTNLQGVYAERLQVCALRRAVHLLDRLLEYHDTRGYWPSRLADAASPRAPRDIIDPMTGEEFGYDLDGDLPRIRSAWFGTLCERNQNRGPWIFDGETLATYFPAPSSAR